MDAAVAADNSVATPFSTLVMKHEFELVRLVRYKIFHISISVTDQKILSLWILKFECVCFWNQRFELACTLDVLSEDTNERCVAGTRLVIPSHSNRVLVQSTK